MRVTIRRGAATVSLAAACLYFLFAPDWEAIASGHEHMHAETAGEWTNLLGKLMRLAETGTVMVLAGIFAFHAAIWPASGGQKPLPAIQTIERLASAGVLYALLLAGSNNALSLVKVAIAIVWLLVVWKTSPQSKASDYIKGLCALALIMLLHAEEAGALLPVQGMIALVVDSVHTAAGAIWIGGGLSLYTAIARKSELSGSQVGLLIVQFMKWAAAACCGILLSSAFSLAQGSDAGTQWKSGPEGILMLLKLLLTVMIVAVATNGYRCWKTAGEDEGRLRLRFRFKQSLRFALSLSVLVLLTSPFISSAPSGGSVLKEPFYWHVMGDDAHMSLQIREGDGENQHVTFDIWLPSGTGEPESAEVKLRRGERAVEVPLNYKQGGPDPYGFEGFDKYTYEADGSFMTESGSWIMEVVVIDASRKTHAYKKTEVVR